MRRNSFRLVLALCAMLITIPLAVEAASKNLVYVVRVDRMQEIDTGLADHLKSRFQQAEADPNAVAVALVVNTPGGLVASALEMKDVILHSKLRTVAVVDTSAISAGALVTMAAEKIYMAPGSSIGAAEPRLLGSTEPVDAKTLSVVVAAFSSTAQARGRNPEIAQAMVDRKMPIPGQKSELLTLTYQEAIEKGFADGQATNLQEALGKAGIADFMIVEDRMGPSERAARVLTTPLVATLLLVVGVAAIGLEFMKPGVTVPGVIGVTSLGLFFLGNVLAGTAGWLELSLALIGVTLLVIEVFVPGFGVFGIGGMVAMVASIFLAVPTVELAMQYLMWAALASVVALFGIIRAISRRGLGNFLTLQEDGQRWNAPRPDLPAMAGRTGRALTVLRPAGTAQFGDERLDVVTEGEFLPVNSEVIVLRVQGTRVVVRAHTTAVD